MDSKQSLAPPVELGDTITTDISEKSTEITIEWAQMTAQKKAAYYSGNYANTAKEGKAGVIFVQKTMLTEFKNKIREGRITVDDSFQYGQKDKTGEGRWLVFHDKKNKIFQHRFVRSVGLAYGFAGPYLEILTKMGYPPELDPKTFFTGGIGLIGHDLLNFK